MTTATVAACQFAPADLDVETNLAAVSERLAGLPDTVDVAVFPEYTLTGFVADERVVDVALPRDHRVFDRLEDLASAYDCALLVGAVERADAACYNVAIYVTPDGERTFYRKRHLWGGESEVLEPGEEAVVVETPVGQAGIVTCYDLNFVAESAHFTRERVDALFIVGAWPAAHSDNWELLVRARALDGVRWVVAAGRTGRRDVPDARSTVYAGKSRVVRPDGSVKCGLNRAEDDLVAELDAETVAAQRAFVGVVE
ncbi:carbon-nitrogen hydrolase family protein [Halospeciosus flavus]|uniref:Carbon-nitrogen hydrolase family protein n=1 Tax=Halospeciosus flavus TaxID=3032283 RepID=A0ABD5Z2Q8_9EURY|nr:carbon-nitrogen hydrolase family protein [Halospeciosus flavus]